MRYAVVGVCLLVFGFGETVAAQNVQPAQHVRAESAEMRRFIADTADRSATVNALLEALDKSDVVVYVRSRLFTSQMLNGRIGFLGASSRARFLAIELACPRSGETMMTTLAHELQHALEIAQAPWVISAITLAEYYGEIGEQVSAAPNAATFETAAAQRIGLRVRSELTGAAPPTIIVR